MQISHHTHHNPLPHPKPPNLLFWVYMYTNPYLFFNLLTQPPQKRKTKTKNYLSSATTCSFNISGRSGMTKVYPNSANAITVPAYEPQRLKSSGSDDETATVLTVWKKSLLLNCNGFTVFDSKGNLVFRVDNYLAGHKGEIVLMDAAGKPLLTIRRKRLSLGDNWVVYDGETTENPRFCATKHVNILKNKCLAHVTSANSRKGSVASKNYDNKNAIFYQMEGSYAQRCCAVYDSKRRRVAEIKRKEAVGGVALGVDVFRLIVQPDMDTAVAMSLVILLDQMYGTSRR